MGELLQILNFFFKSYLYLTLLIKSESNRNGAWVILERFLINIIPQKEEGVVQFFSFIKGLEHGKVPKRGILCINH